MSPLYCTALSHAHFCAIQSKALPNIPSAEEQLSRYAVSCVLMSWAAVEGAVAHRSSELREEGKFRPHPSRKLMETVRQLMFLNGEKLNEDRFRRLLEARNEMVHPNTSPRDHRLSLQLSIETFDFCAEIIQAMYWPTRVVYDAIGVKPSNGLAHSTAIRELRTALVRDEHVNEYVAEHRQ